MNGWWSEVLGTTEYVRTEIKGVRSFRQAMGYVSKYMAKPVGSGRRGGTPHRFEASVSRSLVNVTYLSGDEGGDAGEIPADSISMGRSWGAFNRKCIPWAAQESIALPPGFWMDAAKAWAAERYAPIQGYEGHGFTLFSDEAYDGLRKFEAFCKASQRGRYAG